MAMTKREQAEMDALRVALSEAVALRFLGVPEPVRMPVPEAGYVNGWDTNTYSQTASPMWTGASVHGSGHRTQGVVSQQELRGTTSQNGRRLYATQHDALIALRLATERECAKKLAALDRQIEAARLAGEGAAP